MKIDTKITRRCFLRTLGCLSAFALIGSALDLAKFSASMVHDPIASRLTEVFIHKESAKIVGLEYLSCVPNERDVGLLTNLICSFQSEGCEEFAKADMVKRRKMLLDQQRKDFEHGRIVNVQGWILSETEARLCALAALI